MRSLILVFVLVLFGCGKSAEVPAPEPRAMRMAPSASVAGDVAAMPEQGAESAPRRFLAERQFWVFELPEVEVEARWQAHLALCKTGCEVLNAALSKSAHSPVSASLQLRVERGRAPALLGAMSGPEVSERRVEREDKTLQVIDVEARLKNLGELRDRLRGLLAGRAGSLKDVLETERELARVQGELDAMSAQRQALANETEKILLFAEYRPRPSIAETGALQPLAEAWHGAGRAFAESLAAALLFLVQVLPWLVIVLPAVWVVWKGLRRVAQRLRGHRAGVPPA